MTLDFHPSRRTVLRALGWVIVAPLPLALASIVTRKAATARGQRQRVIPRPGPDAVTFAGDVIVCRAGDGFRVFSSSCTHLGCRIASLAGGELVCPCHGSRFRLDGTVARGPAPRPLEQLSHELDPRTGALIVHVP